jgi:hypothetical protein
MFTSDVPQVLQKRALAALLAPHLGHVTTDIVCETSPFPSLLLGLTFEYVWVWSTNTVRPCGLSRFLTTRYDFLQDRNE